MSRLSWNMRVVPSSRTRKSTRKSTRRPLSNEEIQGINTNELANDAWSRRMRSNVEASVAENEAMESDHTLEQLEAKLRHVQRTVKSLTHNMAVLTNSNNDSMLNAVREELAYAQREQASLHDRILATKRLTARHRHRAQRAEQNTRAQAIRARATRMAVRYAKGGGTKRKREHRVTWSNRIPSESSRPLPSRRPRPYTEQQIAQIASQSNQAAHNAHQRMMSRNTEHSTALNQANETFERMYEIDAAQRRAHREGDGNRAQRLLGNSLHTYRHAARDYHRAMKRMRDPRVMNTMSAAEEITARYASIPQNTRERGPRVTL